jgi:Nif-specific regulatory protein
MVARLSITFDGGPPRVCELNPAKPATLGRSRENTISLQDEHASRQHARIYHDNGRWWIEDCGTLNGTRLNGVRIQGPTPLSHGQEIRIGDTRLCFTVQEGVPSQPLLENAPAQSSIDVAEAVPTPPSDLLHTALKGDELTAMYEFMAAAALEGEAPALVRRALTTVMMQTGATSVGFLSLDHEDPLPKLVLPERAQVDVHLSRQLTEKARQEGRPVWLRSSVADISQSDSLLPFTDALCLPLVADESPLGALHVYKSAKLFNERHLRFCEVMAGFLASSLGRLRIRRALEAENSRLRARAPVSESLIGASNAMRQLRHRIDRIGPSLLPVLIHGETGSGKELVAQGLHLQSPRRQGPLVILNCAAIAPTLIEAELFGHVKGAFTGATGDHPGLFRQADEGTLFLDEIGEMSPDCQGKLLRVIEGKPFRPVGGTTEVRATVRIIAATHRDLKRQVEEGKFRHDLYFRLDGLRIEVPPLRDHADDIPALVQYFLSKLAVTSGRKVTLTEAALARLQDYSWPGNVRQLRAVLENAVVMSDNNAIDAAELLLPVAPSVSDCPPSLNLDEVEAWAIRKALARTESSTHAARLLGIARDTLYAKRRKYKIDKDAGADGSENEE